MFCPALRQVQAPDWTVAVRGCAGCNAPLDMPVQRFAPLSTIWLQLLFLPIAASAAALS